MLTAEGVWKLAGFSFALASDYAVPAGGAGGASGAAAQYTYADAFPPPWDEMSKVCVFAHHNLFGVDVEIG